MDALCRAVRLEVEARGLTACPGFAIVVWVPGESSDPDCVALAGNAEYGHELLAALETARKVHAPAVARAQPKAH